MQGKSRTVSESLRGWKVTGHMEVNKLLRVQRPGVEL